ncbi:sugar transporter [Maritimibacter sp. 55A14]|nr:sugar transporter [Maritimibacter sp. 55A14]
MEKLQARAMIRFLLSFLMASVLATSAMAQSGYQIKPGDALQIEVLEDPNLNRRVLILPDGSFSFPLVGTVQAGGRSVDAVRAALTSGLAPNFATAPTVFVSVAALAPPPLTAFGTVATGPTIDAYIMGEVGAPGKLLVTPGTTILQILAEAGGLTQFAASKRIELRRADPDTGVMKKYLFNYRGTGRGKSIKGSTELQPGDVVVVPQRRLFE